MTARRLRSRLLDLAVASACLLLVGAPFVASSSALESSITENTVDADLSVPQVGIISSPIKGSFPAGKSGIVDGSVSWEIYSSASNGMKLVVSSTRSPALRDEANNIDVADFSATPGGWSVAGTDRKFGFSAVGALVLARYNDGGGWRGFDGANGIEVARKGGVIPRTLTTVKLRGEYGAALPSDARPSASVAATAVVNL